MSEGRDGRQESRFGRPTVNRERRNHVGQVIRKYRTKAGMDQAALAARLGFSKTAVGGWESGRTRPDVDTIPRLCELLGVPVTELLGLPAVAALPEEEKELLALYHRLDRYNRRTVSQLMDRLLFQQDALEKTRLRGEYQPLRLYEEGAAAGVGVPLPEEESAYRTVYAPKGRVPGGADTVIHVNGTSMEPTYPNGSFVYVNSRQEVSYGQTGIFIVNGEAFIKEYRPEGLVSHNGHYKTIRAGEGTEVRCFGRVTGAVAEGDLAAGSMLEKLEAAFGTEEETEGRTSADVH